MPVRSISILVIVLAVAIVVTGGILAYTSTLHQAASQSVQVTWRDPVGDSITSLTLVSSNPTLRSGTVSFICSQSIGPVSLQLSSSIATLTVSPSHFASCSTSLNYVTISASSTNSKDGTATLQLVEANLYQTLPGQLTINVRVS